MIIIRGGSLLSPGGPRGEPGDLIIEGADIADVVGPGTSVSENARVLDARGKLLIPGLVNAHTHTQGNMAKGVADRWTLEVFLSWGPWSAGRKADHHYVSALIGAAEMISKGCTAAYDLFGEFPAPTPDGVAAVAQAYADSGMRAVVAPMMADRTFHQSLHGFIETLPADLRQAVEGVRTAEAADIVAVCRKIIDDWPHTRDRVGPALAPTIPQFCSDAFLTGCRDLARDLDVRIHMHVSESKPDAVSALRRYGQSQAIHLQELGLLGPHFTAAHGVWLTDVDMACFSDNGVTVAHNPGANMKLGNGVAQARRMMEAGITVGVGTDGARSSDNLNMFEAMRLAAYVSRIQDRGMADWISAAEALAMATEGGARALGLEGRIGRLEKGYKADVVFLDLGSINFIPLNDALTQFVYCEDGTGVDKVMIDGRIVFEDGRHTTIDLENLAKRAEAVKNEMRELNAGVRDLCANLEPLVGHFCEGLAREPLGVHRLCGDPSDPAADVGS